MPICAEVDAPSTYIGIVNYWTQGETSLVGEESPEKTTNLLARKNFQPNKVENATSESLHLYSSRHAAERCWWYYS